MSSESFLLDGLDVWKHQWHAVADAPPADVRDPQYHRPFRMPVYRIADGTREVVFAAGEFSSGIFGFYRPGDVASTASPPPLPAVAPRRSKTRTLLPWAPLALAIFTVPWVILMVMLSIRAPEWYRNDAARERMWKLGFNIACLTPAGLGVLVGVIVGLARVPRSTGAWVTLLVGVALCVFVLLGLGPWL